VNSRAVAELCVYVYRLACVQAGFFEEVSRMSSQRLCLVTGIAASLLASASAHAEWKVKGELGMVLARGNTESQTVTAKADATKESDAWKHTAGFSMLYSSSVDFETNEKEKTGDRYEVHGQSDYKFSERSYMFASVRYEEDRFSPYTYQGIASGGYGYRFINTEATKLSTEIGVGYRRTEDRDPPEAENGDTVARGRIAYEQQITATTKIYDTFLVEAGEDNTYLQNEAGIQVTITDALALSLAYVVRHNTYVAPVAPPERERFHTDELITANLVFEF
jgi:putative salt-induced outer membrane protein